MAANIELITEALENPRGLLKALGAIVASDTEERFETETGVDGKKWPARYPSLAEPWINIAGALQDFAKGRSSPKPNRFDKRPVLQDEGTMKRSISSRVLDDKTAEVGPDQNLAPYAPVQNEGGESVQEVTVEARDRLAKWLRKNKRFRERLGFLFGLDQLVTNVVGRRFIGVTPQLERDLAEFTKLWVESGGRFRTPGR